MAEIARWHDLQCNHCKGEEFTKVFKLRRHSNGGTSEGNPGYRCVSCNKTVDMGAMWRQYQREQNKRRIAAMEQEMMEEDSIMPHIQPT